MAVTTGMSNRFLYRWAESIASRGDFPEFPELETSALTDSGLVRNTIRVATAV